ncbi:hypothetical protein [Rhodovarius lipocyclicus]|uniref:hypothetical protein n=1 Tax=Rhodovarius lipocyclicus TaxID=268410 RepID=UPI001357E460|nr:hypothetical protein [Rhodovarius lipocyclicus]
MTSLTTNTDVAEDLAPSVEATGPAARGRLPRKNHGSKWTAEFLVAAELSRRGYTVAFTQGSHTPDYDLLAGTPGGEAFKIDVKGMAAPGVWLVKDKAPQKDLFYVLALVPPGGNGRKPDQFFVLSQEEAVALTKAYREARPNQAANWSGFNWSDAMPHKDAWDKLPGGGLCSGAPVVEGE